MSGYTCPNCGDLIPTDAEVMMRECPHCKAEIIDQLRVMRKHYLQTGKRQWA